MIKPRTPARRIHLLGVFYAIVMLVALAGATQAAQTWLGWTLPAALLAVGALELGGIALAHHASTRRMLGEAATSARIASAVVALAAVAANIYGHKADPGQAAFFGIMSALGYTTWLIDSEARRRDALRGEGMLAEIPPAFGPVQWLREPSITRAARVAMQRRAAERLVDPELSRLDALGALATARQEAQNRVRSAAIARVLHRKIRAAVDKDTADIATAVYDLEQVATRLAEQADYAALTGLIGMDLTPSRLTGGAELPAEDVQLQEVAVEPELPAEVPVRLKPRRLAKKSPRRPVEVTRAMAAEALAKPGATRAAVAKELRIGERRLRQVLNEPSGELPVVALHLPTLDEVRAAFAARPAGDRRDDVQWLRETFPDAGGKPDDSETWRTFLDRTLIPFAAQRINGHDVLATAAV